MAANEEKKYVDPADANAAYMDYLKQQQANAAAGAQTGQQTGAMQTAYQGIKPFKYDFNGDALYQQASQRAQQMGRQAMMDTMGQAATMTGGYGNTYAQNVGQQAYNSYLQGLNDNLPQFQQMAMNKYQMDYAQYQDNQKLAQAQVDYLLSIGVDPDPELLAMAGYSNQYKDSVLSRANMSVGGSAKKSGDGTIYGVMDLGRGPISPDKLADLVAKGDVRASMAGDNIVVNNANGSSRNKTTVTPTLPSTKPQYSRSYSSPKDLMNMLSKKK